MTLVNIGQSPFYHTISIVSEMNRLSVQHILSWSILLSKLCILNNEIYIYAFNRQLNRNGSYKLETLEFSQFKKVNSSNLLHLQRIFNITHIAYVLLHYRLAGFLLQQTGTLTIPVLFVDVIGRCSCKNVFKSFRFSWELMFSFLFFRII